MEVVNVVEVVAETSVVFEVVFVLVSLIVLPSFVKSNQLYLKCCMISLDIRTCINADDTPAQRIALC